LENQYPTSATPRLRLALTIASRRSGRHIPADAPDRLHSARHFGLSLLAALGVHPRVAMEIAGHSDLRTTMMIYSHIASPEMKEAMDRIQEVFGTTQI
jgi:integrase